MLVYKEKNPDHNALETMAVLVFVAMVVGLFFKINVLLYIALCLLFIGIFIKKLSILIAGAWLKFSKILGSISTRIVLTIIYYVFLTPIALMYGLFHKDFISLKRHASGITYWSERHYIYTPKDFENPW